MPVKVVNAEGVTIGATTTENGSAADVSKRLMATGDETATTARVKRMDDNMCVVLFDVKVPADEEFFEIEVGSRGSITETRESLIASDWTVSFSLGDCSVDPQ